MLYDFKGWGEGRKEKKDRRDLQISSGCFLRFTRIFRMMWCVVKDEIMVL